MSDNDSWFKRKRTALGDFFSYLPTYARKHPWATAGYAALLAGGLLLIAGGIVLIAVAPATYGGGAAVGIPLLGVGIGATAGVVAIVGGAVMAGVAVEATRRDATREMNRQKMRGRIDTAMYLSNSQVNEVLMVQEKNASQENASLQRRSSSSVKVNKDQIVRDAEPKPRRRFTSLSLMLGLSKKTLKQEQRGEDEGEGEKRKEGFHK